MATWLQQFISKKIESVTDTVVREAELTRAELATGLAESKRGVRLDAALAKQFRANAILYEAGGRLLGWSLRATGGPVAITFRDGRTPDGDVLGALTLTDGGSATGGVPLSGVAFVDALYAEVSGTGTVVGAVWLGAVD